MAYTNITKENLDELLMNTVKSSNCFLSFSISLPARPITIPGFAVKIVILTLSAVRSISIFETPA